MRRLYYMYIAPPLFPLDNHKLNEESPLMIFCVKTMSMGRMSLLKTSYS